MSGRLRRLMLRTRGGSEATKVTTTSNAQGEWVATKGDEVVAVGETSAAVVRDVRKLVDSGRGTVIEHRAVVTNHAVGHHSSRR